MSLEAGLAANELIGGVWGGWRAWRSHYSVSAMERAHSGEVSQTSSVRAPEGGRNAIEPYGVVPYTVGKHLISPRMASRSLHEP